MRLSARSALALAALAAFTVWITWRAKALEIGSKWSSDGSALVGKMAPAFTLESLEGNKVSLADYRGKTVAVTFWASWCGPCRMELPLLSKIYRQAHRPDSRFEILAVSVDRERADARDAARTLNLPFPVLLDLDGALSDQYKADSIPMLFVVGPTGKILYSHLGFQMGLDYVLAQQLGVKDYSPTGVQK